jgi:hypothetical protein
MHGYTSSMRPGNLGVFPGRRASDRGTKSDGHILRPNAAKGDRVITRLIKEMLTC